MGKAIWITWEKQQRNRSMARHLEAELYEVVHRSGRFWRYAKSARDTFRIVRRDRPTVIYFQNPSVVLGLWLATLVRIGGAQGAVLVGDFHNAGIQGGRGLNFFNRLIARSCSYVIVSNKNLARVVQGWGARPFSFPDPLPDLGIPVDSKPESSSRFRVLFICSWAADEPVEEVMKAAELLPDSRLWEIRITGRSRAARLLEPLPANLQLTGFLPESKFHSALADAHVVMDLTTRDDCMVCGAYEGLAVGKPLVLSANPPTKEWFGAAGSYCDNSAESIARALLDVRTRYTEYVAAVVERREILSKRIGELTTELKQLAASEAHLR